MSSELWSSWFAAIGTMGAFITGGVLLVRELNRDHERQLQREKEQANKIAAWVQVDAVGKIIFIALNNSALPVYNAVIINQEPGSGRVANYDMGMIAAIEKSQVVAGRDRNYPDKKARPVPITFVDNAGQRWLRDGLGILYPATRNNLDALEFPNGIVGGAKAASKYFDSMETGRKQDTFISWVRGQSS